jgi:potassium/hydrogen antiporter
VVRAARRRHGVLPAPEGGGGGERAVILLFAALIVVAVLSTKITSRFGVPVLVAFLGIGLLVGSDVLNLFYFDDALLTRRIADVLLIFIIFEGGFQTRRPALRAVAGPALTLATVGVALTAGLLGLLIHLVTRFDLLFSMMIASIISSTDAAAVLMITRSHPVQERVATTLDVESAANDPMAILLTVAFVEIIAGKTGSVTHFALQLAWQLGGGILAGFTLSLAARFLFERLESDRRGYYHVLVVGMILLTYGLADLVGANGIIAVFFMGYWLGNAEFPGRRSVASFLEGVATFGNVALFLMLGLLAFPSRFAGIWKEGLAIAALVMFAARPLAVLACTLPFRFSWRERLFLAWGGIKGAVPIVLATYPAAFGIDPEGVVFNIIFFAVLLSCLVHGSTIGRLASLLGLTVPPRPPSPFSVEIHGTRNCEMDMFEVHLQNGAIAAGSRIRDLGLPRNTLISSIVRRQRIVLPKGATRLRADDLLFILAPKRTIDDLSASLNEPRQRGRRGRARSSRGSGIPRRRRKPLPPAL